MDQRSLPGPALNDRRFGRRASDEPPAHLAAFVVQVAGLALRAERGAGVYREDSPRAPTGLIADARA